MIRNVSTRSIDKFIDTQRIKRVPEIDKLIDGYVDGQNDRDRRIEDA
jgi:hypothetical protein